MYICYSDIEVFTKYTTKNTYLRHRIKFHMDFEYLHVKWKKNTERKKKITLRCNNVISQRNRTLNVDIYFLTLPPACHKEEGVFFLKAHTCM